MKRLYVVCDADLRLGQKVAQSGHALVAFAMRYPLELRAWHEESNNLVCLQASAADLGALTRDFERRGLKFVRFHEPDLDDRLTSLAVEPKAARLLSTFPLASQKKAPAA